MGKKKTFIMFKPVVHQITTVLQTAKQTHALRLECCLTTHLRLTNETLPIMYSQKILVYHLTHSQQNKVLTYMQNLQ